jgi:hypothetical protein
MFSTGRATDFTPQAPCLMTRRRDASGRAAKGASRRSCKRLSTGRRFGTRHSEGAGDAVTMFSAFSASSCPPRPPGRKPPAAGLFEGSAAKVLTPGISISEGQSRVRDNSNHDGRGGKPRSCVRPPGDNRRQGIRGQGSGVRGQGSGARDRGPGIRGQGSGTRDQGPPLRLAPSTNQTDQTNRTNETNVTNPTNLTKYPKPTSWPPVPRLRLDVDFLSFSDYYGGNFRLGESPLDATGSGQDPCPVDEHLRARLGDSFGPRRVRVRIVLRIREERDGSRSRC